MSPGRRFASRRCGRVGSNMVDLCVLSPPLTCPLHDLTRGDFQAILMVTVPLLAVVSRLQEISGALDALSVLSLVATFSVLPLLPQSTVERSVKWMLFVVGHIMELRLLHRRRNIDFRLLCMVFVATVFLGWYHDFGGHAKVFGERMEFLPLLLISDFCAVFVLASFVRMHVLVARK